MKIIEKINEMEVKMMEDRLEKLIAAGAPKILTEQALPNKIEKAKAGKLRIVDKEKLGEEDYICHKVMKGRNGKTYIRFNGDINYFSEGKYGPFISGPDVKLPEEYLAPNKTYIITYQGPYADGTVEMVAKNKTIARAAFKGEMIPGCKIIKIEEKK